MLAWKWDQINGTTCIRKNIFPYIDVFGRRSHVFVECECICLDVYFIFTLQNPKRPNQNTMLIVILMFISPYLDVFGLAGNVKVECIRLDATSPLFARSHLGRIISIDNMQDFWCIIVTMLWECCISIHINHSQELVRAFHKRTGLHSFRHLLPADQLGPDFGQDVDQFRIFIDFPTIDYDYFFKAKKWSYHYFYDYIASTTFNKICF